MSFCFIRVRDYEEFQNRTSTFCSSWTQVDKPDENAIRRVLAYSWNLGKVSFEYPLYWASKEVIITLTDGKLHSVYWVMMRQDRPRRLPPFRGI